MAKKKLTVEEKLALARQAIHKEYPEIRLIRASEIQLEFAHTGIPHIDTVIRGFKRGGYGIVWGMEGTGKTSLVLYTIAQEQRQGKVCLYASIEARFDPDWAASLGVNLEELLVIERGKSMEDTLMAIERLIKDDLVDTVVIDSVTALLPQQEFEDKKDTVRTVHGDHMAVQARKFSQWFRRTTPLIATHDTCMILVGQGRMEGFASGVARLGLSGGKAQKYYSSTTLKIYRTNTGAPHVMVGDKKKWTGFVMCIILDKTSLTPNEGKEVKLPFVFGVGLDLGRTDVDAALAQGKINMTSKGRFEWTHPETNELHKMHGKTNLYEFFSDEELLKLLKQDATEEVNDA